MMWYEYKDKRNINVVLQATEDPSSTSRRNMSMVKFLHRRKYRVCLIMYLLTLFSATMYKLHVAFSNSKHGGAGYTGRLFRRRSHVQFSIQPYTY